MWELDCEESWALKNWCFWTVVLERTLESPMDCKEIQPVHSEDQPWVFFGRNDAKAETPVLWPPHEKSWLIDAGRDWGQEEKGTTEDEMAGWHYRLDECESEWTLGVGDGQGGLACCNSWGRKESDTTERLNWTDSLKLLFWVDSKSSSSLMNLIFLLPQTINYLFNYLYNEVTTQESSLGSSKDNSSLILKNWPAALSNTALMAELLSCTDTSSSTQCSRTQAWFISEHKEAASQ